MCLGWQVRERRVQLASRLRLIQRDAAIQLHVFAHTISQFMEFRLRRWFQAVGRVEQVEPDGVGFVGASLRGRKPTPESRLHGPKVLDDGAVIREWTRNRGHWLCPVLSLQKIGFGVVLLELASVAYLEPS